MSIKKYLVGNAELNTLRRFAVLGKREVFDSKLEYLTKIAENETWFLKEGDSTMSVIFYYIIHTFDRLFEQEKIVIDSSETVAIANTGLMNPQGEEIFYFFVKSLSYDSNDPNSCYWHFKSFILENDSKFISLSLPKPTIATYFEDYNELYYNPNYELVLNFNHIFGDRNERLPEDFRVMPIEDARAIFNGFLERVKKRIKRNNRIPVPQYYKGKIMFLIPVKIIGGKTIIIACEKIGDTYKAHTTLTKSQAYNCARLITKPESNWLLFD